MKAPVVSIIVPVYNAEPYFRRCLDSVLTQTFTDWECVLVDDTSPDNCPAICDEYTARDGRFRVIHKKENGGLSLARNDGLDAAYGEYVFFLDSDDFIADYAIERLLRFAVKNDLDFAEGRTLLFYGNNSTKDIAFVDCGDSGEIVLHSRDEVYHFYLGVYKQINATNKLIKRKFLAQNNIRFIKGLISEDLLWLYLSVLPNVRKAGFIQDETYYYDKSVQGTLSGRSSESHITSYMFIIKQLLEDKVIYDRFILEKNNSINRYIRVSFVKLARLDISIKQLSRHIKDFKKILRTRRYMEYLKFSKNTFIQKAFLIMIVYNNTLLVSLLLKLYGRIIKK